MDNVYVLKISILYINEIEFEFKAASLNSQNRFC